jgi:predicted TIM-barrel fold metal-dependent hydrolase
MSDVIRPTVSEQVRARLDHPVIDADGHSVEFMPALISYLREEGVTDLGRLFRSIGAGFGGASRAGASAAEIRAERIPSGPWWALPAQNTLDVATATFPRLLRERLDQFGIDFAVVYPTVSLGLIHSLDDDLRPRACRAVNRYHADAFRDLGDRITPVAVIPMQTPDEALAELDHAVGQLGMKAVMVASYAQRPVDAACARDPELLRHAFWLDFFGIDSEYDYDPVWARCVELGVAPGTHSGGMGWGSRRSPSTYMFNHIGHFAAAGEALCKALFFGGVTRRFPKLRVAFLEGGVHWAVGLLGDLVARWEKRNIEAVQRYDPRRIDRRLYAELFDAWAGPLKARMPGGDPARALQADVEAHDDFERCGIRRSEDVRDLFVPNFYFGCEADDPMTATAFDTRRTPFGARLSAIFSSDIGHWDVPDMTEVLEEAHEAVDRGWLDAVQFRDFTFANAARLYTDANPAFFQGTAVEEAVARELSGARGAAARAPATPSRQ